MPNLPEHFIKTITSIHDDGAEWLAALDETLEVVAPRYDLVLGDPFKLSYNYVCAAAGGAMAHRLFSNLARPMMSSIPRFALRHYGVEGCVELLEADPDAGIVILERLFPGTMLRDVSDDEDATRIAAEVMKKLWKPLPDNHNFPTVARSATGLQRLRDAHGGGTGPLPASLVGAPKRLTVNSWQAHRRLFCFTATCTMTTSSALRAPLPGD